MSSVHLVLTLVLAAAAAPAGAATIPAEAPATALDAPHPPAETVVATPTFDQAVPIAALRHAAPGAEPDPFDRSAFHAMWDPLGGGCIDGGSADEPFPSGKGDLRAAAFCLPQPCARSLTPEELARDVLGRALRPGEWDTYVSRYAEACRHEAVWPQEVPAPDWMALAPDAQTDDLLSAALLPARAVAPAAPRRTARPGSGGAPGVRSSFGGGGGSGGSGGGGFGNSGRTVVTPETPLVEGVFTDVIGVPGSTDAPAAERPWPEAPEERPGRPTSPDGSTGPIAPPPVVDVRPPLPPETDLPGGGPAGAGDLEVPAPVPLPPVLPLLASAVGALALLRRRSPGRRGSVPQA